MEVSYPLFVINSTDKILVSRDYTHIFGPENPFLYIDQQQFIILNPYYPDPYTDIRPDWSYASQLVTLGVFTNPEDYNFRLPLNETLVKEISYLFSFLK